MLEQQLQNVSSYFGFPLVEPIKKMKMKDSFSLVKQGTLFYNMSIFNSVYQQGTFSYQELGHAVAIQLRKS